MFEQIQKSMGRGVSVLKVSLSVATLVAIIATVMFFVQLRR
jgi:hypothetical protein